MARIITGLRAVGVGGFGRALLYSLHRWRLERRVPRAPGGAWLSPGVLQSVEARAGGAFCRFQRMDLELQFLAPDLLRVTWGPAPLPVPYTLAKTEWPPLAVHLLQGEGHVEVRSQALQVDVEQDGALRIRTPAGRLLREERPPERRGESWHHRAPLRPREHLYGLGNRVRPLNLRGQRLDLWNRDPGAGAVPGQDPVYLCIPVYLAVHEEGCFLIFYENTHRASLRFAEEADAEFSGGALRYYLIAGPPARVLERYSELTGRPHLPPRWALGYHQSRWSYASADEVRHVVDGFHAHNLPLSAIHLDIDYMDGFRLFTVDRDRFPDLPGLARDLAARDVALVTILDCGVKTDPGYRVYTSGIAEKVFCTHPDGEPFRAPVWPGWCVFPDFTDPRARAWWGEQYRPLLEAGIAGFWHDMNEPAAFAAWGESTLPRPVRHNMEGRGGDHGQAHNLYGLLGNRAGWEALRRLGPERRPFIFTRSGWAGVQRYAWTWTGDVESSWRGLQ